MAEDLNDLLALDHLFDVSIYIAQLLLLLAKVKPALTADDFDEQEHEPQKAQGNQGEPRA